MATNYAFHDLITVSTDIDHGIIPDYFEVDHSTVNEADLTLQQGEVDTTGVDWKRCGTFFFGSRNDALLIDYQNFLFDTKIEIANLGDQTKITMTDSFDRFGNIDVLFNTILFLKLVQKGYSFVHSGCVSRNGNATLVSGMRDTGKTSTTLSQFDGENVKFMSDDLTILSPDGTVYAFPREVGISPYTLTGNVLSYEGGTLKEWIAGHQTLVLLLEEFTRFELSERVHVDDRYISNKSSLENVFVLNPHCGGAPEIEEVTAEQAANKLFETTVEMFDPFRVYSLNFYAYVTNYDKLTITNRARSIMRSALEDANCYQLNVNEVERYAELVDGVISK